MRLNNLTYRQGWPVIKSDQLGKVAVPAVLRFSFSFSTYRLHYIKPSLDKLRQKLNS